MDAVGVMMLGVDERSVHGIALFAAPDARRGHGFLQLEQWWMPATFAPINAD
jgi:hypothetical protein